MNHDTPTINLVGYVSAFMASLSLFSLVDATHQAGSSVVAAATSAYLLPLLAIVSMLFLALAIIAWSRFVLPGGRRWNSAKVEENILFLGLGVACLFGVLAAVSYLLATIAPESFQSLAHWLTRSWAVIFAACFALLAYQGRPERRGGFMALAAVFVTLAIFGIFF
ncbi:hypothetical protein FQV27_06325 [Paracoccus aurantiacus]|uniref:Uncharacterized protein n=1 Tax=Paracoccus aurantiacus TaxID=2599412 RepID=A0A5C6S7V8_9RHOB|nr:hypothetical protein [Paracoccus aurantiacus]TXB69734.1 hypothetical protein FQV27_06325 [Paracoccus aurantiacus]